MSTRCIPTNFANNYHNTSSDWFLSASSFYLIYTDTDYHYLIYANSIYVSLYIYIQACGQKSKATVFLSWNTNKKTKTACPECFNLVLPEATLVKVKLDLIYLSLGLCTNNNVSASIVHPNTHIAKYFRQHILWKAQWASLGWHDSLYIILHRWFICSKSAYTPRQGLRVWVA